MFSQGKEELILKKKLIAFSSAALAAMLMFCSCSAGTAENGNSVTSTIMIIVLYGAIFAAIYFFMIRPNSKQKKKDQEMRNNLEIGDDVTTIGGITGKVVSIKEETDSFVLETGADRTKIQFKRWAISTVDTVKDEPTKSSNDDTEEKKGRFGRKK